MPLRLRIAIILSLIGVALSPIVQAQSISGVVNDYYAVDSIEASFCRPYIFTETPTTLVPGDRVLLIQMKGALVDPSAGPGFGSILTMAECGNYEMATVFSVTPSYVEFENILLNNYNTDGEVQLVKVATYASPTVNGKLLAQPWNGSTGGIIALEVSGTLTLNDSIDASASGFRGALPINNTTLACSENGYAYDSLLHAAALKGEGVGEEVFGGEAGRAPLASAGGGGNSFNAGGGGGGNAGQGGTGGNEYGGCAATANGGIGGYALTHSTADNKLFMGGGGGAGDKDSLSASAGGNGGGIVFIIADEIIGNNHYILTNGQSVNDTSILNGAGGGGAAGTIILNVNTYTGNLNLDAQGGNGGLTATLDPAGCYGPGAGGGGGAIWHNAAALPAVVNTNTNGGAAGTTINPTAACHSTTYGATNGANGSQVPNATIVESDLNPVEVLSASNDTTVCLGDAVPLFVNATASSPFTISWSPAADLDDPAIANPTALPTATTTYSVALFDAYGCFAFADIVVNVESVDLSVEFVDTTLCQGGSISLGAFGAASYQWSPALGLDNPTLQFPTAFIADTTTYQVVGTNFFGCTDTAYTTLRAVPPFLANVVGNQVFCEGDSTQLLVQTSEPGRNYSYNWNDPTTLSSVDSQQVMAFPTSSTLYTVTVQDEYFCFQAPSISVTVNPIPAKTLDDEYTVIRGDELNLNVTDGDFIIWSPDEYIDDPASLSPTIIPFGDITYVYTITNTNGCSYTDSLKIDIITCESLIIPNIFTPNGDGVNDEFKVAGIGLDSFEELSIYNRWGELVFYTRDENQGWDGTYQGQAMEMEVYLYKIKGICSGSNYLETGNVTLVR